jgi:uncharacterized coiled-coil protein SlyX
MTLLENGFTQQCQSLNNVIADRNNTINELSFQYKEMEYELDHLKKSLKALQNGSIINQSAQTS